MSTRSRIGILNEDGTVTSIYCHHDGYISHVGRILDAHYCSEERVRKLISLGDISSIGVEPEDDPQISEILDKPGNRTFSDGWHLGELYVMSCSTFRSRGENDVDAYTSKSIDAYKDMDPIMIEYSYLFKNKKWYVCESYGEHKNKWRLLRPLVIEELKKEKEEEEQEKAV